MKNRNVLIISLIFLGLYVFLITNINIIAIENANIPALSVVNTKTISDELYYLIDTMTYNYHEATLVKKVSPSIDSVTPGEARDKSNLISKGNLLPGMQKVLLLGSDLCENGLNTFVNMIFSTRTYSDLSQCAVISTPGKTFLDTNLPGNDDLADFVEGLIKNARYDNFFTDKYKIMDVYLDFSREGYNLVLPYIKLENSQPSIGGMVLFKKDKLVNILDLNESKLMNLLRQSDVSGNVFIKDSNDKMVDCVVDSKRKVICNKIDDKYYFTIKLSLKGEVVSNTIYKNLYEDQHSINELQERFENKLTSKCNSFINQMQNTYKVDCLNLGSYIIAKEGFNKNIDWDELVCNSEIKVVVDLLIQTFGRGDF